MLHGSPQQGGQWSDVQMLNPEARRARARLAAYRRWHPDDGVTLDELTEQCMREIELSGTDDGIDDLVAAAPKMTDEQKARVRRLADSLR
jgi:hypothetical protein